VSIYLLDCLSLLSSPHEEKGNNKFVESIPRDNQTHTSAELFMSAVSENGLFITANVTLRQRTQGPSQAPSPLHSKHGRARS
jgi:hypothetical protein